MPYDRFTTEMLAGDLLPARLTTTVIATGFHRNTTTNTEGGANAEEYRFAAVVDRVNTTMQVWMGTTFGCAQCHNHKYDPFTQKEYYQVFAIFNGTADSTPKSRRSKPPGSAATPNLPISRPDCGEAKQRLEQEARIDAERQAWENVDRRPPAQGDRRDHHGARGQADPGPGRRPRGAPSFVSPEWSARDAIVKRLRAELDQVATTTLVMKEAAARATHVAIRGEYQNQGEAVVPGLPGVLPACAGRSSSTASGWRGGSSIRPTRSPLAWRSTASGRRSSGSGSLRPAKNSARKASRPSHPELLDWLATEFIRLGWNTKRLLKEIVTSATYRQGSRSSDELARIDPYNRLLARGPRMRLTAEAMRDQALASSGLLSPKMYGPPVHPFQPVNGLAAAFGASTDWETSRGDDCHRRALYTRWRRNLPYPSMIAFDVPERAVCSMRRVRPIPRSRRWSRLMIPSSSRPPRHWPAGS